MNKNNIAKQLYNIILIPPDAVERLGSIQNNSVTHLTREELEVYHILKGGGTAQSVAYKAELSAYDVMGILWKLEQKGVAERGYIETKNTKINSRGKNVTQTNRQEYFIPTEEGKKLGENSDSHNLEVEKKNNTAVLYDAKDKKPIGFDFSKLSNPGLKDLVLDPECGAHAKGILENRGYYVHIKDGKVTTRKKSR
jgi:hypothetical protein